MRSAPLGQDVLFDEKDVELGRNFCNKLWNACRFRQMQGGDVVQGEIERTLLNPDDKWILLKLDAAIREVTIALNEYKFSEATAALYRFFWKRILRLVCGGEQRRKSLPRQVEEVKGGTPLKRGRCGNVAALRRCFYAAKGEYALAVIDFVLSHTLRMFHPFLPFITEELWHGMGYATDMPLDQGGKTIMNRRLWPLAVR